MFAPDRLERDKLATGKEYVCLCGKAQVKLVPPRRKPNGVAERAQENTTNINVNVATAARAIK